jgi:hypothetical protein
MKHLKISICCVISILAFSCQKEIKLDEDEIKPRIVVNSSFLSNDTMQIWLSESRNILYDEFDLPNIENATATLNDLNGNVLGTFTHIESGLYELNSFLPLPGVQYTLKVSHPDFDDVSSTSWAPTPLSIVSIETTPVNDQLNISILIDDNGNETNYYSIGMVTQSTTTYTDFNGDTVTEVFTYDEWGCTQDINFEGASSPENGEICSNELLISDKNFNGTPYTLNINKYINNSDDVTIIYFRSISEDLFKYRITLNNYEQNSGNPFGEPVQVYSNVENGFGVFSGYSEYSDTIN